VRRVISFFRAWEPRAWAALLLVTAGVWAALALAEGVEEGATARWDEALLRGLRHPDDPASLRGPRWLAEMVRDVTALGSVIVLTSATVGVTGFLALAGRRQTALFLMVAALGGALMASGLKMVVDRPRPNLVPHLSHVSSASFPSGHSMMAAVVYLTLGGIVMAVVEGRMLKMYVLAISVGLTVLVGASRVLLGVHYPSDVIAGWTIGLAWSEACWLAHAVLTGRLKQRRQLEETAAS
jgi:undecaprenyl-diphosphatase